MNNNHIAICTANTLSFTQQAGGEPDKNWIKDYYLEDPLKKAFLINLKTPLMA